MNWRRVDFDWNQVRAFLVTAEEGSYSAAAAALRIAQPTVGRQVAALEQTLGVRLFDRKGRGVALTKTGLALVEHVRAMADAATQVSRVAAGQATSLEGPITITASAPVASALLPPLLTDLRRRYPGLSLEVVATHESLDLRRRDADLAIRNVQPREPDLLARRLPDRAAHLYASKAYLKSLGPVTPASLSKASFLGFSRGDAYRAGLAALGLSLGEANFVLYTQDLHVQWALVRAGMGIAMMLSEIGDADPLVRRVLPSMPGVPIPMWLVTHQDVKTSQRVRVVADALAEGLTPRPKKPSNRVSRRPR